MNKVNMRSEHAYLSTIRRAAVQFRLGNEVFTTILVSSLNAFFFTCLTFGERFTSSFSLFLSRKYVA